MALVVAQIRKIVLTRGAVCRFEVDEAADSVGVIGSKIVTFAGSH